MHGKTIIRKHLWLFVVFVISTFVVTGLEMITIGAIIPLFNVLFGQQQADVSSHGWIVGQLYNFLHIFPRNYTLTVIFLFFLFATVFKVAFKFTRDSIKTILSQRVLVGCQKDMFRKMIYSELSYFIQNKSGELVFRIMNLPREVSAYFLFLPSIFLEIINVAFLSLLLVSIAPKLFSGVMLLGAIYAVIIHKMSKGFFEKLGSLIPKAISWQNIITNESVGGIRDIMINSKEEGWMLRFFAKCQEYYQVKTKAAIFRLIPGNIFEAFIVGGICLLGIYYGRNKTDELIDMLPVLAVYAIALVRMLPSFSKIGQERIQLATYIPSVRLYENLLQDETTFRTDGTVDFPEFKDGIRFENVSFSYQANEHVIERLNLFIPKNKTIAIVGSSGAGKTTITDLVLGLYDVNAGEILVDGVNLNQYRVASWREHIGVVPQNSFIFNASIKENIAFDFENVDMNKVREAACISGAEEFIDKLLDGYDTVVGDRGYSLSGGQRQRISIARAFYRDPDIIIFDEATSALDNRTENMITKTISSFANKKTMVILAHRLSTIKKADRIYVLKDKKVSQMGTHEQLLQEEGEYRNLYKGDNI